MALGAAPLIVLAVRRTLAPLEVVLDEASRIDVRSPGVRLSEGRLPREIAPLIAAVNSALDRLEEGYASQARFMTDAAHELRTPVAILQTRIESLSAGMDRTALTQDVTRLALLCEQLLDLQRINQGVGQRTAVDLGQLARQCAADLAPLAISANREIGLEFDRIERRCGGWASTRPRPVQPHHERPAAWRRSDHGHGEGRNDERRR